VEGYEAEGAFRGAFLAVALPVAAAVERSCRLLDQSVEQLWFQFLPVRGKTTYYADALVAEGVSDEKKEIVLALSSWLLSCEKLRRSDYRIENRKGATASRPFFIFFHNPFVFQGVHQSLLYHLLLSWLLKTFRRYGKFAINKPPIY